MHSTCFQQCIAYMPLCLILKANEVYQKIYYKPKLLILSQQKIRHWDL